MRVADQAIQQSGVSRFMQRMVGEHTQSNFTRAIEFATTALIFFFCTWFYSIAVAESENVFLGLSGVVASTFLFLLAWARAQNSLPLETTPITNDEPTTGAYAIVKPLDSDKRHTRLPPGAALFIMIAGPMLLFANVVVVGALAVPAWPGALCIALLVLTLQVLGAKWQRTQQRRLVLGDDGVRCEDTYIPWHDVNISVVGPHERFVIKAALLCEGASLVVTRASKNEFVARKSTAQKRTKAVDQREVTRLKREVRNGTDLDTLFAPPAQQDYRQASPHDYQDLFDIACCSTVQRSVRKAAAYGLGLTASDAVLRRLHKVFERLAEPGAQRELSEVLMAAERSPHRLDRSSSLPVP